MYKFALGGFLCFAGAALAQEVTLPPQASMLNSAQGSEFYGKLSESQRADLIKHVACDLGRVKNMQVQRTLVSFFYRAHPEYGARLARAAGLDLTEVRALIPVRSK